MKYYFDVELFGGDHRTVSQPARNETQAAILVAQICPDHVAITRIARPSQSAMQYVTEGYAADDLAKEL